MNVCTFTTQVFGIILWYIKVKERRKEKRHVFFTADVRTCKGSLHFYTTAILLIYESIAEVRTIKKLHLYSCEPPNESIDWLSRQPKCLLRTGRGRLTWQYQRRRTFFLPDTYVTFQSGRSGCLEGGCSRVYFVLPPKVPSLCASVFGGHLRCERRGAPPNESIDWLSPSKLDFHPSATFARIQIRIHRDPKLLAEAGPDLKLMWK